MAGLTSPRSTAESGLSNKTDSKEMKSLMTPPRTRSPSISSTATREASTTWKERNLSFPTSLPKTTRPTKTLKKKKPTRSSSSTPLSKMTIQRTRLWSPTRLL